MATNLEFIKSASGSSVSEVSVTDCFSSAYDHYLIFVSSSISSTGKNIDARLLDNSNAEISTSTYDFAGLDMNAYTTFSDVRQTGQTRLNNLGLTFTSAGHSSDFKLEVFNPNNSAFTFFLNQMTGFNGSNQFRGRKAIYVEKSTTQCKGIKFLFQSSVTSDMTVSVYGVK